MKISAASPGRLWRMLARAPEVFSGAARALLRGFGAALIAGVVVSLGIGLQARPPQEGLDLLARREELARHGPTGVIIPGDSQALGIQGMVYDPKTRDAWASQAIAFDVNVPADRDLELRIRLRPMGGLSSLSVRASIGARQLGSYTATSGADVVLSLPADALQPGLNRVHLSLDAAPGQSNPPVRRAFIERLEVQRPGFAEDGNGVASRDAPPIERDGSLVLPGGTAMTTWISEGGPRWLVLGGACTGPGQAVHLRISDASGVDHWSDTLDCADPLSRSFRLPELGEPARLMLFVPAGQSFVLDTLRIGAQEALSSGVEAEGRASNAHRPGSRPNLIIYCVDTLRADALGSYGSPSRTTPNMDAFARESVQFAEGFALSPWTRTSVATLLTGHQPFRHKANRANESLNPKLLTLAQRLKAAGYRNEAIITNGNIGPQFGFGAGYDDFTYFSEVMSRAEIHMPAGLVTDEVLRRIGRLRGAQPFHLYVHVTDPHFPYTPSEPFRAMHLSAEYPEPEIAFRLGRLMQLARRAQLTPSAVRFLRDLYEGEVASVDVEFGRLLEGLRASGLYDDTVILLTADHGEQFLEHGGVFHGFSFFGELVRVPFLLKLPRNENAGRVVSQMVNHLDVVPTVLALAGMEADPAHPGRSLVDGGRAGVRTDVAVYTYRRGIHFNEGAGTNRYLLIVNRTRHGWRKSEPRPLIELYDRWADPAEHLSVSEQHAGQIQLLLQRIEGLRQWVERYDAAPPKEVEIDPELREKLENIGYVD